MATLARDAPRRRRRSEKPLMERALGRWIRIYIPILVLLLLTLFPFYWMAITTFKSPSELFDFNQSPLFVRQPTLEHWRQLLFHTNFPRWSINTMCPAALGCSAAAGCPAAAGCSTAASVPLGPIDATAPVIAATSR